MLPGSFMLTGRRLLWERWRNVVCLGNLSCASSTRSTSLWSHTFSLRSKSCIFTLGRMLKISCVLIVRKYLYLELYIHTGENVENLLCSHCQKKFYIQSCILIQRRMLKNPYVVRKFYIQCREETGGVVLMSREVVNPEIYRVRWWMAGDCKIDQHIFKFEGSPASHISEFHL